MSSSPAPWPGVIGSYTLYLMGIAKKKGKECPSDPEERHKLLLETAQGKSAKQEDLTTYKEEVEDAGANFNAETSGRQLTLTMTRPVGYKKDIIGALRNTIKEELPRLLPASDGKETLEEYKKNSVRVSIKKYGQGFSRNQFIEKFHGTAKRKEATDMDHNDKWDEAEVWDMIDPGNGSLIAQAMKKGKGTK